MNNKKRKPIIICAGANGRAVVFGHVDKEPVAEEPVTLYDARMIISWSAECGGLFGLAAKGPAGDTKITAPVPDTTTTVWKQSLTVTPEAAKALVEWPDMTDS